MKLWVDADACPGPVKDVIIRAAQRLQVVTVFVANKYIGLPDSGYLSSVRIGVEPEAVDEYIAGEAQSGDIAVTQDIPLASLLVPKGVVVLNPRGERFTEENVRERLSIRNFMQDLREAGSTTPGPRPFSTRDKQTFSNALDRELTRMRRNPTPAT